MNEILVRADGLARLHRNKEAENLYKEYLKTNSDPEVYESLGNIQLMQKKYYEAIDSFSAAVEKSPSNAKYFASLGNAFLLIHRYADAKKMYTNAARISGKVEYQLKVADIIVEEGNPDEALILLYLILSKNPENPDIYSRIALIQHKKGMEREAMISCLHELKLRKQIVSEEPSADSWYKLGRLCGYFNQWDKAKDAFSKSLKCDNVQAKTHIALGDALIRNGNEKEGLLEFEKACSTDALDFNMYVKSGDKLTELNKYDEAISFYARALELENVNADTWVAIAYALYKKGDLEDARAFYEMAKATVTVREMPWANKMHKSKKTEELDKVL